MSPDAAARARAWRLAVRLLSFLDALVTRTRLKRFTAEIS
jgi:hypothetical protein